MDRFELAPTLVEEILAHARKCYPEEACGIIAGTGFHGSKLYRGCNRSPTPLVAFELDPETLALQMEFENAGLTMTAIYHSHPAGPEILSELDIQRAFEGYPSSVYIVCSLADCGCPVLRAFRIADSRVAEVSLVWAAAATA
jgi:[CysO sulfur-carrier protein]-S-L-cysteine hydrolase